jgi:hypothetical protein
MKKFLALTIFALVAQPAHAGREPAWWQNHIAQMILFSTSGNPLPWEQYAQQQEQNKKKKNIPQLGPYDRTPAMPEGFGAPRHELVVPDERRMNRAASGYHNISGNFLDGYRNISGNFLPFGDFHGDEMEGAATTQPPPGVEPESKPGNFSDAYTPKPWQDFLPPGFDFKKGGDANAGVPQHDKTKPRVTRGQDSGISFVRPWRNFEKGYEAPESEEDKEANPSFAGRVPQWQADAICRARMHGDEANRHCWGLIGCLGRLGELEAARRDYYAGCMAEFGWRVQ